MSRSPARRKTSRLRHALHIEPLEARCLLSAQIIDLGEVNPQLFDGPTSTAWGINDFNASAHTAQVVGSADSVSPEGHFGFWYDVVPRQMHRVKTLDEAGGGQTHVARDINNVGQVVGSSEVRQATLHAFLYDTRDDTIIDLGTLGGQNSHATGINDSGLVVGYSHRGTTTVYYYDSGQIAGYSYVNTDEHAFVYDRNRTPPMRDIGAFGGTYSEADAINNSGQVVGGALSSTETPRAFRYDLATSTMTDLGDLGGGGAVALGINDNGQIVGASYTPKASGAFLGGELTGHAFLYDENATPRMRDLGALGAPGESRDRAKSGAHAINSSGQIVGYSFLDDSNATFHAFVYTGGAMHDLNDDLPAGSGWVLQDAKAINDAGQIAGYGMHNGEHHAFLLTLNQAPVANAGEDQTRAEGTVVAFDASGSFDSDGTIANYAWTFGDGSTSTATSPTVTHRYTDNGTFTVTLTVTDNNGATAIDTASVTIQNVAPSVHVTAVSPVTVGQSVTLAGTFTDPGRTLGESYSATIDWGDGDVTSAVVDAGTVNGSHLYAVAGNYTATVTVTDNGDPAPNQPAQPLSGSSDTLVQVVQPVTIDIKPESLNLESNGTITLVIYGGAGFNASLVNVDSVRFAGAAAWQSMLVDANQDGQLDLQLKFQRQQTNLDQVYAQLLLDDFDADGVLDSTGQIASVAVTGQTQNQVLFTGSDDLTLFLAGRALRNLLESWFGAQ